MIPILSARAFKYLKKIDRNIGFQHSDEEVHEIGARLLPKLSDSCGRNVHLRIKEAFVLTLLVEWWTERRNCLGTTLFSALNAATWTRKAVLVHTPSVAMADQWVCY